MTEYTWDKKTGKVKAKGKGKKPINLKKVAKNIAELTILPLGKSGVDTIKKLMKEKKKPKPAKDLGKSKAPPDDTPPDRPKAVWVSKGGPIRKNKGGPVDARKIAKKYFKGTF